MEVEDAEENLPPQTSLAPKIQIKAAANRLDSATFVIRDEDHTLGNALRYMLMKKYIFYNLPTFLATYYFFSPAVALAGYSVPHPSDPVMHLRVQTKPGVTAVSALQKALKDLQAVCDHVGETMEAEVSEYSLFQQPEVDPTR